jgi:hypothetical protein
MKKLFVVMLIVLAFTMSKDSFSQITSSITAKGTVLAPISVVSKNDLNFGTSILPGIPVSVDKSDYYNAGKFSLAGVSFKQISISLDLPTDLSNGSSNMPITFGTSDAGTRMSYYYIIAFNPNASTTAYFGFDGKLDVLLGGKVSPSHTQEAGNYQATVQISLAYTGS